nr:hypothetical protein CFP56_63480 [Quercus suber]
MTVRLGVSAKSHCTQPGNHFRVSLESPWRRSTFICECSQQKVRVTIRIDCLHHFELFSGYSPEVTFVQEQMPTSNQIMSQVSAKRRRSYEIARDSSIDLHRQCYRAGLFSQTHEMPLYTYSSIKARLMRSSGCSGLSRCGVLGLLLIGVLTPAQPPQRPQTLICLRWHPSDRAGFLLDYVAWMLIAGLHGIALRLPAFRASHAAPLPPYNSTLSCHGHSSGAWHLAYAVSTATHCVRQRDCSDKCPGYRSLAKDEPITSFWM